MPQRRYCLYKGTAFAIISEIIFSASILLAQKYFEEKNFKYLEFSFFYLFIINRKNRETMSTQNNPTDKGFFDSLEDESNRKFKIYLEEKKKENISIRHQFTAPGTRFDAKLLSADTAYYAENKTRSDFTNEFFLKEGYGPWMQFDKWSSLCELTRKASQEAGRPVGMLYNQFTKDGLLIFRLSDNPADYNWYAKELPKSKSEPNNKVWKMVCNLTNPCEILKLNFENGK
jgi:hypothetical protein